MNTFYRLMNSHSRTRSAFCVGVIFVCYALVGTMEANAGQLNRDKLMIDQCKVEMKADGTDNNIYVEGFLLGSVAGARVDLDGDKNELTNGEIFKIACRKALTDKDFPEIAFHPKFVTFAKWTAKGFNHKSIQKSKDSDREYEEDKAI